MDTPHTLLSAVHALTASDAFSSSITRDLHPFAQPESGSNALSHLKTILTTGSLVSVSLSSHLSLPVSDPKLVSMMRQHAALIQEVIATEEQLNTRIKSLRERCGVDYGEDMPSSKTSLVEWFLTQIESWGSAAGMQLFNEPETDGKLGLVLAGKILVLDIELRVMKDNDIVKIELTTLKSSHASPLDAPATSASSLPTSGASLDTFLATTLREYLEEIQKDYEDLDAVHIAKLGRSMKRHFQYIMKLDGLAQREIEGGSRWFTEVDDLYSVANQVVPKEAETVAKELGISQAPLDILLLRGHALPLPYLRTPSLSFLVYLPPSGYLTLLRGSPALENSQPSSIDISPTTLREYLSRVPSVEGPVIANLSLEPSFQPSQFAQTHGRPTFPLLPPETLEDPDFQSLDHILPVDNGPDAWVLDFGLNGVVMSQSRMWEIQALLGLASASDAVQMIPFGYGGSWVDLVVKGVDQMPHERYTALHESPTNAHPPLHLRLSSPLEPGFILRKIRVQSMRDIWAICEIVKEQSWYNGLLNKYKWTPEGQEPANANPNTDEATEEDVDALLNGTLMPSRIPVNVVFTTALPSLFEQQMHRINPALTMVFPSRDPGAPLINAAIALDSSSTGVRVMVNGVTVPSLEEFVRRGGGLGLVGQLWLKTGMMIKYHESLLGNATDA